MHTFHLSHTDLDGYSCQLVARKFLGQTHCYNSNYGPEVSARLDQIANNMAFFSSREPKRLLITDLNISKEECKQVEKIQSTLENLGHSVEVVLLDHHKSGEAQAAAYGWYHLDSEKSATRLTLDWCEALTGQKADEALESYVQSVNAYDIWLTEDERFEFGKTLNRLVMDSREISAVLFSSEDVAYRHFVLEQAFEYLESNRYIELDDAILSIKKRFLAQDGPYDSIDNLAARYVLSLLGKNRGRLTIEYAGHKGVLTFQIGNTSVLGNAFLKAYPEFDFFMDINRNGNIGLRADNKIDVSQMAAKLFGGGGHANAAGGRLPGVKDIFVYDRVKELVTNHIRSHEETSA